MQWSDEENAGFTDGDPWPKLNENYTEINVEAARDDPDSAFHHCREPIDLRNDERALVYGEYDPLLPDHERIYAYTRALDDETRLVVLNCSNEWVEFVFPELEIDGAELLYGNYEDTPISVSEDNLRPYEAAIYRL